MPSPVAQVVTVSLACHPAAPSSAALSIGARVSRHAGGWLAVTYVLEGEVEKVKVPAARPPQFRDHLWHHTCCEVFIQRKGETSYDEFNFSPSSEWAVYAFARSRERAPLSTGVSVDELNPQIVVRTARAKLELDTSMRLGLLSPRYLTAGLRVGVSVIVEDENGALSYWALRHPLDKPDFHHPGSFALELNEVRH